MVVPMGVDCVAFAISWLGIGSLTQRSHALLLKWLFRFLQEDCALWRKVVCRIYG